MLKHRATRMHNQQHTHTLAHTRYGNRAPAKYIKLLFSFSDYINPSQPVSPYTLDSVDTGVFYNDTNSQGIIIFANQSGLMLGSCGCSPGG